MASFAFLIRSHQRWNWKASSSLAGRKRSSSCAGTSLPPSKRNCSSSLTKHVITNRVYRRVIVSDYGKSIYKARSLERLLAALEGRTEGYESLHTRAGLLQRDISPDDLILSKDAKRPHLAFVLNRPRPCSHRGARGVFRSAWEEWYASVHGYWIAFR
jgi:hypothetical protein